MNKLFMVGLLTVVSLSLIGCGNKEPKTPEVDFTTPQAQNELNAMGPDAGTPEANVAMGQEVDFTTPQAQNELNAMGPDAGTPEANATGTTEVDVTTPQAQNELNAMGGDEVKVQ